MKPLSEKPRPGKILPTEDEFIAWCQSPVTEFVAMSFKIMADLQKEDWLKKSWDGEKPDPIYLAICKARADTYMAFLEADYKDHRKTVMEHL